MKNNKTKNSYITFVCEDVAYNIHCDGNIVDFEIEGFDGPFLFLRVETVAKIIMNIFDMSNGVTLSDKIENVEISLSDILKKLCMIINNVLKVDTDGYEKLPGSLCDALKACETELRNYENNNEE